MALVGTYAKAAGRDPVALDPKSRLKIADKRPEDWLAEVNRSRAREPVPRG